MKLARKLRVTVMVSAALHPPPLITRARALNAIGEGKQSSERCFRWRHTPFSPASGSPAPEWLSPVIRCWVYLIKGAHLREEKKKTLDGETRYPSMPSQKIPSGSFAGDGRRNKILQRGLRVKQSKAACILILWFLFFSLRWDITGLDWLRSRFLQH